MNGGFHPTNGTGPDRARSMRRLIPDAAGPLPSRVAPLLVHPHAGRPDAHSFEEPKNDRS